MFYPASVEGEIEGAFKMRLSAGETKDFEEWVQMYEAALGDAAQPPGEEGRSRPTLRENNHYSVDAEQLYREDKLGCARGVLWAVAFEAGLVVAAVIYWKLRLFAR